MGTCPGSLDKFKGGGNALSDSVRYSRETPFGQSVWAEKEGARASLFWLGQCQTLG